MNQYIIPERLDRNSVKPLYVQMYEQLKKELVLGPHRRGERFFSYRQLKTVYKTELRTISSAVDLLVADGLLEKRGTSGIYVTGQEQISEVGNVWYAVIGKQVYHPFFFNVLMGVINEAARYGLRVIVRVGENNDELFNWFRPRPGEGLIITGDINDDLLKVIGAKCNNNVIAVGNYNLKNNFGCVTSDCNPKVHEALRIAANCGCRKFALITGSMKFLISQTLRTSFAEFCREYGNEIKTIEVPDENGYEGMKKLEDFHPDCVFTTELAFSGAWEYLIANYPFYKNKVCTIRYGKEKNDHTLEECASIEIACDSVKHGQKALQMLLNNSKDIAGMAMEINCNHLENIHA